MKLAALLLLLLANNVFSFQPTVPSSSLVVGVNQGKKSLTVSSASASEAVGLTREEDPSEKKSAKGLVISSALGSLASVSLAAKAGLIKGPGGLPYSNILLARDCGASVLVTVLAYVFVKTITRLAKNGVLHPRDSRKIIHTLSAPLFLLCWPLFSKAGRWFAACAPLTNAIRLWLAGRGAGETELANAVSRSGNVEEAGGGPFLYCLVTIAAVMLFWTDSLAGVVAICAMAVGDGLADIVGRRLGKNNKWFFSERKSMAGSLAFWVGSATAAVGLSLWLSAVTGVTPLGSFPTSTLVARICAVTGVSAVVELIPIGDDNWTVPTTAALLSMLFLQ